jgi:hypothetical protein
VGLDGSGLAVQSVFDSRIVTNPLTGQDILMQSVPTSITTGPDGAFYVGELTGIPFLEGSARIFQVSPGNEPKVYADGFTQIVDLAFDTRGNLYVLEYATDSLLNNLNSGTSILNTTGALIRVAPDGTRTTIASDGLISPNSVEIGPDNAIYVSNYGTFAGQGQIIRIPTQPVPENTSILGLLAFGTFGAVSLLKRKQKSDTYNGSVATLTI